MTSERARRTEQQGPEAPAEGTPGSSPPAPSTTRLTAFVHRLVRRERGLLAVRVVAGTSLVGLAALIGAGWAAHRQLDRPAAAMVELLIVGIGSWFTAALPLTLRWRAAGDARAQARRVEALRPELRGRLVTAVHHAGGPAEGGSPVLLDLVVRRAEAVVERVAPAEVHPSGPAVRLATLASGAWAVGLVILLVLGPLQTARYWLSGAGDAAPGDVAAAKSSEELARVGDLVVRYTYPDYTGLPPKEVPNGTGDVAAPPGTTVEVRARSAAAVEAAGLVAYDERLEARVEEDGRSVSGTFSIGKDKGLWHLVLYRGAEPEPSRDFAIEPQEDLPPDVMLDAGDRDVIEVAADQPVELTWSARDDYGVRKVGLAIDGKDTDKVLERPERRQAEVTGTAWVTPRDLHLEPGARVRLSVVAWDNDTVSGSKRGESRAIELVVLGASGMDQRMAERREELVAAMVPILARFLTEPWPPGTTAQELARWGEVVAGRYQPLSEAVERLWQGIDPNSQDRAIVDRVLDTGRKLVRYTQVSFEPNSVEAARPDATDMLRELEDSAVVALEDAILAYHKLLYMDALADISRETENLENASAALAEALKSDDAQEMLSRLDQLERMLDQLAKQTARLADDSGLKEFLNTRDSEARNLMEEIRKAVAEGRLDDARKMMERLSKQIGEMSQGIRDEMARMQRQSDEAQEQGDDLKAELEQLEAEQRQLQTEVQSLRKEDRQASEQMADLWAELAKRAAQHEASATAYRQGLDSAQRPFFERERAQAGVEEAGHLKGAIDARDVSGARTAVAEGQMAWAAVGAAVEGQIRARGRVAGPGAAEVRGLLGQLDEIERLLEQMEQAESRVDPQTLQRSRELEGKQRDLDNRLKDAQGKAEQFEQQFPVRPQGMQEALQDAQQRMDQAAEDLQQGQPMQAEGSQGVAAQRIRDAIESIEQAQQQAQQMQQGGGGDRSEQQPQDGDQHRDGMRQDNLEIPDREEFRTPEEYRRALLEGMEGEVPEEYRALKQRYFEELVQ